MNEGIRFSKTHIALFLLTVMALIFRLSSIHEGFWRDEVGTWYVAGAHSFAQLISRVISVDLGPPGFPLLIQQWEKLVGDGDVVMKIPSLVFGLLLIPIMYILGKQIGGRIVGIMCAIFATLSPQAIFYSLQCRVYSLAAVLYCLAVFFYCRTISKDKSVKNQAMLVLCLALALYTHYIALILMAALMLATIVLWKRKQAVLGVKRWAIIFLLPLLTFIPCLKIMFLHIHTGSHWAKSPLWFEWIRVFLVNILLGAPVSFELVPIVLFGTLLTMLVALTALKLYRHKDFFAEADIKNTQQLIVIVIGLLLPASLEGYLTPQTDRYMFPFAPLEWIIFSVCALVWWRHFELIYKQSSETVRKKWRLAKIITVSAASLAVVYFNGGDVLICANLPLSGAGAFSRDLSAGKFKNTAFIFIPDMSVCTISYYLKRNKQDANTEASLSSMHGCIRWDDKSVCNLSQYAQLLKNPNLLITAEEKISNLALDKYSKIILVREGYMPNTEIMPCEQIANALQKWMEKTYKFKRAAGYLGRTEGYILLVYDRN